MQGTFVGKLSKQEAVGVVVEGGARNDTESVFLGNGVTVARLALNQLV
jgi:hypothetical protein